MIRRVYTLPAGQRLQKLELEQRCTTNELANLTRPCCCSGRRRQVHSDIPHQRAPPTPVRDVACTGVQVTGHQPRKQQREGHPQRATSQRSRAKIERRAVLTYRMISWLIEARCTLCEKQYFIGMRASRWSGYSSLRRSRLRDEPLLSLLPAPNHKTSLYVVDPTYRRFSKLLDTAGQRAGASPPRHAGGNAFWRQSTFAVLQECCLLTCARRRSEMNFSLGKKTP